MTACLILSHCIFNVQILTRWPATWNCISSFREISLLNHTIPQGSPPRLQENYLAQYFQWGPSGLTWALDSGFNFRWNKFKKIKVWMFWEAFRVILLVCYREILSLRQGTGKYSVDVDNPRIGWREQRSSRGMIGGSRPIERRVSFACLEKCALITRTKLCIVKLDLETG